MKQISTPAIFQPSVKLHFPPFQTGEELEWQMWQRFRRVPILSDYSYLPIMWCPYYVSVAKYATNRSALDKLKSFLRGIRAEKCITTNIYDGWPIPTDKMIVFSGSGSPSDGIPIPLICDPHPDAKRVVTSRKILLSAKLGKGTHPIRGKLLDYFDGKKGCVCSSGGHGKDDISQFRELMKSSTFALAPRGSGPTSFRMYEALQYNCIPVYVSDVHWLPFKDKVEWDRLAVLWGTNLEGLYEHLCELQGLGRDLEMREYGAEIYDKYFTYDGCFQNMKRIVEEKYR